MGNCHLLNSGDLAEVEKLLLELLNECKARQTECARLPGITDISMYNTYVHDTYRRIIIVIDELAEILDKKRFPKAQNARIDNIIGYLSIIACTGRAFGVHLILGTQRRSAVHLNQKQRHKKEEIRTHLPQGRISSDFLHLVRPTRFAPPGHKLRTVSGNKNAHPGWGGYFYGTPDTISPSGA